MRQDALDDDFLVESAEPSQSAEEDLSHAAAAQ
jgi:hypothetical protein